MRDDRTPIAAASLELLRQGAELLSRLDAGLYTAEATRRSGTVGGHFRHVLDFYARFLAGLEGGEVGYDTRERDPRVEADPERARQRILEVAARLAALDSTPGTDLPARTLVVAHDHGEAGGPSCPSSVGRELMFLASHTTHHFALIAALLRVQGFEPGDDFGVAVVDPRPPPAPAAGGGPGLSRPPPGTLPGLPPP